MDHPHQGTCDPRGGDDRYLVTDEHGERHDVGPLVQAVLSLHRHHPMAIESGVDLDERDHLLVTATATAALEAGVRLAVFTLFGPEAAQLFSVHCGRLVRDLEAKQEREGAADAVERESTITCPGCGHPQRETMEVDSR